MANLRGFANNIRRVGDTIPKGATALQRFTAGAILNAVVMATPVGNPTLWERKARPGYVGGRARGNWQVSNGRAATGVVAMPDKGGSNTITKGRTAIGESVPGQGIHITNNVPYIKPLDEGHSKQAPAGFVHQAIMTGVAAAHGKRVMS